MKKKPTLDEVIYNLKKRYGIRKLVFGNDLATEISQIRGEKYTSWKTYLTSLYNKSLVKVPVPKGAVIFPPKLPKLTAEQKAFKDKYWKSQRRKQS